MQMYNGTVPYFVLHFGCILTPSMFLELAGADTVLPSLFVYSQTN
jgi:hypothetical protein